MAGGLKPNWQKELSLPKPAKKSTTSCRNRSIARAPSTSATSLTTAEDVVGEFDQEESESSLRAARAATGKGTATARMGITLTKKPVVVDVNGKAKTERKRRYTNADLPFPPDGHAADVKHFQDNFIPDLTDWAATLTDPFVAHAHPSFVPTVENIWAKYFSAYPINGVVQQLAASAFANWRSDIGKRTIKVITEHLATIAKAEGRRNWIAEQAVTYLMGIPSEQHLFVRQHSRGGSHFAKTKYQDPKGNAAPDIFENSTDGTDGDESSEGYTDPRSRIIISDDEFEEGGNDGPESDFGMFNAGSDDDNNEDIAGSPGPVPEVDSEMPVSS
ncbi:hypothetical protein B0H11DRAFT_2216022 [Mycena galericulata]|nr:hypothetical protein B0H11DRAFT_2216022 [Mycena galericulata]